ncbi:MAG: hypothetical protein HY301_17220 [Verrucomicrobia bacterium]|nr:hypothetical protein [Verrucomicrobiota bacterium]
MKTPKTSPRQIRLEADAAAQVKAIAERMHLSDLVVIRLLVKAGARAIIQNGTRFTLPLKFEMDSEPLKQNLT